MRNSRSKLRKVLPLVLGLAVGTAYADNAVNDSVFNTTTGDFVFVMDYMHKTNRNEKTDVNALIKGGNIKRIYAFDPSEAIKSRINFMNSARAKQFYSEEQRLDLIGRYQNFLNELSRQKIAPGKKSLEALSTAVMDGEITPEELSNVEDNIYAIVKEGFDKKVGDYSVFYLTNIVSDKTPNQYQARIKELENSYNDLVKKEEEERKKISELEQKTETPELSWQIRKPQPQENLPLPEIPKEEKKQIDKKKEKGYTLISLIAQGNSNFAFDTFGGSLGARINPFKDKNIGLGALLDVNLGLDKQIDSYSGSLSAGRTAYGTVTDTNAFSIGLSAEAQLGPFILGGGADYSNWIRKTVEQILDSSGNTLKSNTNSLTNSRITGKVYGGFEVPLTDAWKLGAVGGYSGKNGPYFGIRSVFRLNQPKK
jgi:hypothetical protein